jgi:hypothetical protein
MTSLKELQKNINNCLEKIIEDFTEILSFLKHKDGSKYDQMKTLVFCKRRTIDLTENVEIIFKNLVMMKYLNSKKNEK